MFRGIIVDRSVSCRIEDVFNVLDTKLDDDWQIKLVEVDDLFNKIPLLQSKMFDDTWYAHFYDDKNLVVVFKNKCIIVDKNDKDSWDELIDYAKYIGIPNEQLDFYPLRTKDEKEYFGRGE